jgi:hypothetical protein
MEPWFAALAPPQRAIDASSHHDVPPISTPAGSFEQFATDPTTFS